MTHIRLPIKIKIYVCCVYQVSKGVLIGKMQFQCLINMRKAIAIWKDLMPLLKLPATTMHIGSHLNRKHAIEVAKNTNVPLKITSCIKYLARQGLPLRGHDDGSESNFGEEHLEIHQWMEKIQQIYLT